MPTEATIPLADEIPLILSVTDKNGNLVPNAVLSSVQWSQDNDIGEFVVNPNNPNLATFKPSKGGVTKISATAVVTIS
jgi:hypothetical protein